MIRYVLTIYLCGLWACVPVPGKRNVGPSPAASADSEPETVDDAVEAPLLDDDVPELDETAAVGEAEVEVVPETSPAHGPHPLAELSDEELEARLLSDPASLGPISLGRPGGGALMNAVPMPEGPMWKVVNPSQTYATQETIDALVRCIEVVNREHPGTPPVRIGDISEKNGGHIAPHSSHQSGRDVDVGYYYTTGTKWYVRANDRNLDLARSWTFVKAMITETDVQAIFIDRRIQRQLEEHARSIGEDPAWLDDVFHGKGRKRRALITHQPGHDTHIHVRFYNPIAQETGRRVYPMLLAHEMIDPPTSYVRYKAKKGDNLGRIARKYRTSVKALRGANGLRSNRIFAGRVYRIPRRGGVPKVPMLVLPARRIPGASVDDDDAQDVAMDDGGDAEESAAGGAGDDDGEGEGEGEGMMDGAADEDQTPDM